MKVLDAFALSSFIAGFVISLILGVLSLLGVKINFEDLLIGVCSLLGGVFYFLIARIWKSKDYLQN